MNGGDLGATFAGAAEDVATLANPTASGLDKAIAVVNLASELAPVSTRDVGDAAKVAGKGIKAIGEWGENKAAKEIAGEGGKILSRQEPLSTGSRGDIVYQAKDGKVVCCEVKAGKTAETAPLSQRQSETKAAVNSGETVTTRDGTKIDRYEERRYKLED